MLKKMLNIKKVVKNPRRAKASCSIFPTKIARKTNLTIQSLRIHIILRGSLRNLLRIPKMKSINSINQRMMKKMRDNLIK